MELDICFLELDSGKCPYLDWEQKLDRVVRGAVRIRINRIRLGNFGDCKTIKGTRGLYELRLHLGAGYRLYFGKDQDKLVIMLCGGSKRSQERDIDKAKDIGTSTKKCVRGDKNGQSKGLQRAPFTTVARS